MSISDTGRGVLYTSDSDGIVFSESLHNHVVCSQGFPFTMMFKVENKPVT